MSIIKAMVNWTSLWQREYKVPKGFILLRYEGRYRKNVAAALQKLDQIQKLKMELRPIDMTLDIHYQKRSLDQNALMWSLYEIEANEMNGGRKAADMETPQHIYEMDMQTFAPKIDVNVTPEQWVMLRRNYSMGEAMGLEDGKTQGRIYITTSHWNTKEMHDHLEMIFDRLSMAGVDLKATADISHYWFEWRAALNEQEIMLHDVELYTVDEYKDLVKNCEACGRAVWHEDIGSSVAHIKAVGMGGHRDYKYHGSEIMHLCDIDHQMFDNGKGRDKFLEDYPHLTYKVNTGLNRSYGAAPVQEEIF